MTEIRVSSPKSTARIAGCFLIASLLVPVAAYSQSDGIRAAAFDAASIRPATAHQQGGEGSSRTQIEYAADSLTMQNIDLREMIQWAYGLQQYQVTGPSSLHATRYDVRARTADPVPLATLRLMLQDLLATRFKLQLHREQKRTAVYELVVAKGAPQLPKDKTDTLPPGYSKENLPRVVDGGFVFTNVTLSDFAKQLTELRGIDLPVIDRTGIHGIYDITLKSAASAILDPQGPSLLTLIHEQLGLKLVVAKDPMDVVVIDRVEQASAN
jgi:uncharacterized protein (TIGR03435 family)